MPRCLPWKRVPGYTIPMVPMHLPLVAPMKLVKQIRALGCAGEHAQRRVAYGKRAMDESECARAGAGGSACLRSRSLSVLETGAQQLKGKSHRVGPKVGPT
jgi:hypothetical protein